ncbi:UNVERIFIED_CONTAM: hypothetical protein Sradi_7247900 [Sesamum radiatum]|uniref:Reverse transcriptase domain-containing protein n=1 Tax=Sesamum radiatum TaxID=300843 RepID=A0AAW2IL95_SESRA
MLNRNLFRTFTTCLEDPVKRRLNLEFLRAELKHTVTTTEASLLVAPVTQSEVKEAFFDIDIESAPGPDGYTAAFYRTAWPWLDRLFFRLLPLFQSRLMDRSMAFSKAGGDLDRVILCHLPIRFGYGNLEFTSPFQSQKCSRIPIHWKCKEIGLTNLCFADDVLLFCKAQLSSIKVLTDTLTEFATLSGLKVNQAKSQIILSSSVQQERQQILEPLIDKVDARLAAWINQNLSYAGRLQLIKLRQSTIWTFNSATGSWGWKKLLKLRPLLRRGVTYKIGDGSSFNLWQDIWHERGPLCLTFPQGPRVTGLPLTTPLSSVLQQPVVLAGLDRRRNCSAASPTDPTAADMICWNSSSGKYTLKSAVSLIQPSTPRVFWFAFFKRGLTWASKKWRGNHLVNAAFRATLAALVYHLWTERNNRKFAATSSPAESITSRVLEDVRMRILTAECPSSLQVQNLYRIWHLTWPIGT